MENEEFKSMSGKAITTPLSKKTPLKSRKKNIDKRSNAKMNVSMF